MTASWDPLADPEVRTVASDGRGPYAYVYELVTGDPQDGPHPYVGKAKDVEHRVYGRGGHTSRDSVAKDAWKARILPAPHGYRVLETVPATGDPIEDERTLRTAEAYWMRKLRTTHNEQRPAYDPQGRPVSRRLTTAPARPKPPSRAELAAASRRRAQNVRLALLSMLFVLALFPSMSILSDAQVTGVPYWTFGPGLALAAAVITLLWLDGLWRRITRPQRRRSRR
jgi:hypothetical protein